MTESQGSDSNSYPYADRREPETPDREDRDFSNEPERVVSPDPTGDFSNEPERDA
jgi:hypothetical protein